MGESVSCSRCSNPALPADKCKSCGYARKWRCTRCNGVRVNKERHPCDAATAAKLKGAPGPKPAAEAAAEPLEGDLLESPPAETFENARPRVREVSFQPDGSIVSSRPGLPGEEILGSAWLMATEILFGEGTIDEDTVVAYPGGPDFVTVGTLLREGKIAARKGPVAGELRP